MKFENDFFQDITQLNLTSPLLQEQEQIHSHNLEEFSFNEVPIDAMDESNNTQQYNSNVQQQVQNNTNAPPNTILDQPTEIRIRNYCKRAHNQPLQPMCITNCEKVQKNHTLLFMHNGGAPAWVCISVEMKKSDQQNIARNKKMNSTNDSNSTDKSAAPQLYINGKNGPTSFDEFILSSKGDFHKVELQPKYSKFEGNKRPSFVVTIAINGAVVFSWESVVYHRSTRVKYSTDIKELSFKSENWNGERFNSSLIPLSNTPLTTEVASTYLDFNSMNQLNNSIL